MRVLIADDHALIRDGLKPFLRQISPTIEIQEAGSLAEALRVAAEGKPDCLLLDLKMPGMKGIDSLKDVKATLGGTRVVILSGTVNRATVLKAIELGAAGYLPKSLSAQTMMHALGLILSGGAYFPTDVLTGTAAENDLSSETTALGLTRREKEILLLLAGGSSNKEIARRLNLTEITIKSHLRNIFRKIGVQNRTQAAALVIREQMT